MTVEDAAEKLASIPRELLDAIRNDAAQDSDDDPVDRVLAVAAFVIGAATFAWPTGRKLPRYTAVALGVGRRIWARRDL